MRARKQACMQIHARGRQNHQSKSIKKQATFSAHTLHCYAMFLCGMLVEIVWQLHSVQCCKTKQNRQTALNSNAVLTSKKNNSSPLLARREKTTVLIQGSIVESMPTLRRRDPINALPWQLASLNEVMCGTDLTLRRVIFAVCPAQLGCDGMGVCFSLFLGLCCVCICVCRVSSSVLGSALSSGDFSRMLILTLILLLLAPFSRPLSRRWHLLRILSVSVLWWK